MSGETEIAVRRFRLIGRTTDGRKWAEFVTFTDEFLRVCGLRFLGFIASSATGWDEHHDCKTVRLEMEPFPEGEYERLLAVVAEEESLSAGQVWQNESTGIQVTILSVEDGHVAYEGADRRDFYGSDVGTFLDAHYLVHDGEPR